MITIDLEPKIAKTFVYSAHANFNEEIIFELNVPKFTELLQSCNDNTLLLKISLKSSTDIMFLAIAVDAIRKDFAKLNIVVYISYFNYRNGYVDDFVGKSFSFPVISRILNTIPVDKWIIYNTDYTIRKYLDANVTLIDDYKFLEYCISNWSANTYEQEEDLFILVSDNSLHRKIDPVLKDIGYDGNIATIKKEHERLLFSVNDFQKKSVFVYGEMCMYGEMYISIAKQLETKNCGKLYLVVNNGFFYNGVNDLMLHYKKIYTTDAVSNKKLLELPPSEFNVFQINPGYYVK